MISTRVFTEKEKPDSKEKNEIIDFLFKHLDQYGDAREDIARCIGFALKEFPSFGGFVIVSYHEEEISGVVVVNRTGMTGYIPDNILVYIATHRDLRGKGIGKQLMKQTLDLAEGDVKLHVEPDNPARFLYEKIGFTSKYLEMRYIKDKA